MSEDELRWELGELDSMAPALEALDAQLADVQATLEAGMDAGDRAVEAAANQVEDVVRAADEDDQLQAARAALN